MVKITSRRGYIKAVAVVTKRFERFRSRRTYRAPYRSSNSLGDESLNGKGNRGFSTNTLSPSWGESVTQTPEYKTFLVNIEKAEA